MKKTLIYDILWHTSDNIPRMYSTEVAVTTELSTGTKVLLVAAMIHAALFGASFFYMASALAGAEPPVVQKTQPDVIAPYVTIIEPTEQASLFGDNVVAALAYDEAGVGQVSFVINGRLAHIDRSAKFGWTMEWNTRDVPEGAYTLSAIVEDRAGNIGYSP
ncbi:MAG: Ig-like domain-containing protein, partial [Parcubacteria group bacterium]